MHLLQVITLWCCTAAAVYWLLPDRLRSLWLLLMTAGFLAAWAPVSLLILAASTTTSYWMLRLFRKSEWAVLLILGQNVGYFVVYKLGVMPLAASPMDRLLPLGLSYYAFRQIHYVLEWYKEKLAPHTFFDYGCYLFFLPTILSGPIHRFPEFQRDHHRRRWNSAFFSAGLERILYGFSKIILLGNWLLGIHLDHWAERLMENNVWLGTYLNTLEYTLSAYFLFAGFSDVAIGLSLLFGYRIMENFNYPFLAPDINEFWNRWHISLSSWVKDYVYFPLAGMTRRPLVGILATMLVIGLWHEFSWRYLIWGLFHGVAIAIWHGYKDSGPARWLRTWPGYRYLAIGLTFHVVLLSFVLIREPSWADVQQVYLILLGGY